MLFFYNTNFINIFLEYGIKEIGVLAFSGSINLKSIVLPNSLERIENRAFSYSSSLEYIFIPSSVKFIGYEAFSRTYLLKEVYMTSTQVVLEVDNQIHDPFFYSNQSAKYYCVSGDESRINYQLANTQTSFTGMSISNNNDYFYDISNKKILKYIPSSDVVTVPNTIDGKYIDKLSAYVFTGNPFLKEVTIEEGITKFEDGTDGSWTGTFKDYINISVCNLPNSLTYVGSLCFYQCKNIKDLNLTNVTSIGYKSFALCQSILKLTINRLVQYSADANNSASIGSCFSSCISLEEISINSVDTLVANMFENCGKLNTINSNSVKNINDLVFENCLSLEYYKVNNLQYSTVSTKIFSTSGGMPDTFKGFICESKSAYNLNKSLFSVYESKMTYKVLVQYQNVVLFNNPSFTNDFQNKLNQKNTTEDENGLSTYTYYANDELLIPTLSNFNTLYEENLKLYIDSKYLVEINSNNTTSDNQINNGKLNKGIVNDTLVVYCNLYIDPTKEENQLKYQVSLFDNNNSPLLNTFTSSDLNKEINLRFTNDKNTGTTGLPVVGYNYTYTWYVKKSNSTIFDVISNNNKQPSTLTFIPATPVDLDSVYRCTIQITPIDGGTTTTFSKDISFTYIKDDTTTIVFISVISGLVLVFLIVIVIMIVVFKKKQRKLNK